jgi:hypothetical protein
MTEKELKGAILVMLAQSHIKKFNAHQETTQIMIITSPMDDHNQQCMHASDKVPAITQKETGTTTYTSITL